MPKRRPMLDITRSIQYQIRAQVEKVKSHFIQSAREHIEELYGLHLFESDAEHLQFIDSLLADNKYLLPVAGHVEGAVHSPNPTQSVESCLRKASVHFTSWRKQSRVSSTSNFIIRQITAVRMLMYFIIP
jgi:hypothetical protein